MADDYPNKYAEYAEVLKEKEFQQTLRNKVVEARRLAVATAQLDADVRLCFVLRVVYTGILTYAGSCSDQCEDRGSEGCGSVQ